MQIDIQSQMRIVSKHYLFWPRIGVLPVACANVSFRSGSQKSGSGQPGFWDFAPITWPVIRHAAMLFVCSQFLVFGALARADELQDFANQCDAAIGATVPDFDCDAGTEVPGQGNVFSGDAPGVTCDQPNRLNMQCDPGSRFQVLTRSDSAYVVAHCRHEGGDTGKYGDIAVIQYSRKNGATCFYQSLGDQAHGNLPAGSSSDIAVGNADPKPVKSPSKGLSSWPWMKPSAVAHASFACGSCHDNGPLIRSPYLNQVQGPNALPGSDFQGQDGFFFNNDPLPYAFVGADFAGWKAFKVEVSGNECNDCHRLGVNNLGSGGTALDFALRATAPSETSKNPPSNHSIIWMPPLPPQVAFDPTHAASAKAIHDCALRAHESPLPNGPDCRITLFASAFIPPVSQIDLTPIYNLLLDPR